MRRREEQRDERRGEERGERSREDHGYPQVQRER